MPEIVKAKSAIAICSDHSRPYGSESEVIRRKHVGHAGLPTLQRGEDPIASLRIGCLAHPTLLGGSTLCRIVSRI